MIKWVELGIYRVGVGVRGIEVLLEGGSGVRVDIDGGFVVVCYFLFRVWKVLWRDSFI